jgi:hypothetical protein
MLEMPRRSVTRFFIPLIDVLTLLFCVFLVMPLASNPTEDPADMSGKTPEQQVDYLREENKRLRREGSKSEEELKALRQKQVENLRDRLLVRVLEIDGNTGALFRRNPDRIEIATDAQARQMVERDRLDAADQNQLPYYIILYPRTKFNVPTLKQESDYKRWFEKEAHKFDIPAE